MKLKITLLTGVMVFIFWLGNSAFAGNEIPGAADATVQPSDTSKKTPPPPPAQMLTFPISSITAKMTLNGYSQVRYQYYLDDKTPSNFDIRNARLILKGTVLKNVGYNFQCDFAPPTVRLMDASMSYTFNKYAKLTAGQQKIPLSYESLRTDYDIHSISRSQVVEALTGRSKDVIATASSTTAVNNNGRDIGVVFSGGVPNEATQGTWVDYSLGVFNGMGINRGDADKHKDIGGRAVVHPIKYLGIGGSVYNGEATYGGDLTDTKKRNRWGLDAAYEDFNRIYAAVEFLHGVDSATTRQGYYGLVEGFFIPKKLSALVKYDFYDPNVDKDTDGTTIYSFGLNWYFAAYTKVQLQYDYKREQGGDELQKKNDLLSIQAQVFF
jgi:phosphate-selective porin OprO/OprP